jgi:hypothetical protein
MEKKYVPGVDFSSISKVVDFLRENQLSSIQMYQPDYCWSLLFLLPGFASSLFLSLTGMEVLKRYNAVGIMVLVFKS